MKIYNYFWLTSIVMLFFIGETDAFTSQIHHEAVLRSNELQSLQTATDILQLTSQNPTLICEVSVASIDCSTDTQEKLNYLYFVCIGLVLINLIAQIKIIYQIIHLVVQFRQKDKVGQFTW